jgi:prepilin-type N-terminal cleavage/methylation domain-containing protein
LGEITARKGGVGAARSDQRAFSLLELLVVMVIIGVAWFALLPNLDLASRYEKKSSPLDRFMDSVREKALSEYSVQAITVTGNGKSLEWNGKFHAMVSPVYRCEVNGQNTEGWNCGFRVYKDGIMDQVRLVLLSGEVLESDVLRVGF